MKQLYLGGKNRGALWFIILILALTAVILTILPSPVFAEDQCYTFENEGAEMFNIGNLVVAGINASEYYSFPKGVFGRSDDDRSIRISPSDDEAVRTSGNPFFQWKSTCFTADDAQYFHGGLSFASKDKQGSFGLGGKITYKYLDTNDNTWKTGNGFTQDPPISVSQGKIQVFGNTIGSFEAGTWYSVDFFVKADTGALEVYLNGVRLDGASYINTSLQGSGMPENWIPTGFQNGSNDPRLNIVLNQGQTNDYYFDDARFGAVDNVSVNAGLTAGNGSGIAVEGAYIDLKNGIYTEEALKADLDVPAGASLHVDIGSQSAALKFKDGTSYIYYLKNNGPRRYDFDTQTNPFSEATFSYAQGLGGKAEGDYAIVSSADYNLRNIGIDITDGSKLTIEGSFLAAEYPPAGDGGLNRGYTVLGPVFGDTFANTLALFHNGDAATYAEGVSYYLPFATYKPNQWYRYAAVFTGNSNSYELYVNGFKAGTYTLKNSAADVFQTLERIKFSVGADSTIYLDDLTYYKADYMGSAAAGLSPASGKYVIDADNSVISADSLTAGELEADKTGARISVYSDGSYTAEISPSEALAEGNTIVVKDGDGMTMRYYTYLGVSSPGVHDYALQRTYSEDGAKTLYTFTAQFEEDIFNPETNSYFVSICGYDQDNRLAVCNTAIVETSADELRKRISLECSSNAADNLTFKGYIWDNSSLAPCIGAVEPTEPGVVNQ